MDGTGVQTAEAKRQRRASSAWRGAALTAVRLVALALAFSGLARVSGAQNDPPARRNDDGITPLPLAPGRPVGSFPLSGFDSISPFSGRLNVALPLLHVGGRGDAGADVVLRVRDSAFRFVTNPRKVVTVWDNFFTATNESWASMWVNNRYSPGVMLRRPAVETDRPCAGDYWTGRMLMRLNFVKPDGTEIEFRGRGHSTGSSTLGKWGEPVRAVGPANCAPAQVWWDKTFKAADGSGATFVFDSQEIVQQQGDFPGNSPGSGATGWLYFRNGTRYHATDGSVDAIADRNGNLVNYTYAGSGPQAVVTRITDSLGRIVQFDYAQPCRSDSTTGLLCDRITYAGQGLNGGNRTIEVGWAFAGTRGRPARLPSIPACAVGSCSYADLFPTLANLQAPSDPQLKRLQNGGSNPLTNFWVVAWVQLPTGGSGATGGQAKLRYDFYYNQYGEIAAIRLPTEDLLQTPVGYDSGGIIEYDWETDLPNTRIYPGSSETMTAVRRVVQRREYTGSILKAQTYYSMPRSAPNAETAVDVRDCIIHDGNLGDYDRLGRFVTHYYKGSAGDSLSVPPLGHPRWDEGLESKTEISDGANTYGSSANDCTANTPAGPMLKRVINQWLQRIPHDDELQDAPRDARLMMQTTTLGNVSSNVLYDYDEQNNITHETISGYSGEVLRYVHREYSADFLTPEAGHLKSLLMSESVSGPAGNESTTTYGYDETDRRTYTPAPIQYAAPEVRSPQPKRGNATTITVCSPDGLYGGCHSTQLTYDQVGNVVKKVVAAGEPGEATTHFNFTDRYALLGSGVCPAAIFDTNTGENTYAFPTRVTQPNGFETSLAYDKIWGQPIRILRPTGLIDEANSETDPYARMTSVQTGCGGHGRSSTRPRLSFNYYWDSIREVESRTQQADASGGQTEYYRADPGGGTDDIFDVTFVQRDALSRESNSHRRSDDGVGNAGPGVETRWDGMGRKAAVSVPAPIGSLGAYSLMYYDALDRIRFVKTPDDKPPVHGGWGWSTTSTSYSDNQVTVSDPQGHWKTSTLDALGRVTQVDEGGIITKYGYDGRGNLTLVRQGAQARTFEYDGFGLLRKARNPESGEAHYSYDGRGNLKMVEKFDLAGGRQVKVSMTYDLANRITAKVYAPLSAFTAPNVTYQYDAGGGNNIGKLTRVSNGVSSTDYTYDDAGNLQSSTQTTAGNAYTFQYDLDRLGNVRSETYPSGRVVLSDVDRRSQVRQVKETTPTSRIIAWSPRSSSADGSTWGYMMNGALQRMSLGNGVSYRAEISGRSFATHLIELDAPAGGLLAKYEYLYPDSIGQGNDGNLYLARTTVPKASDQSQWAFEQRYTFDGAERLTGMIESFGAAGTTPSQASVSQSNGYDIYGNRWISGQAGFALSPTAPTSQAEIFAETNQIGAGKATYDALGNNTKGPNGQALLYDAEGRVTGTTDGTIRYEYDGEGRRIRQTISGVTTLYVYDGLGRLAAEYGAPTDIADINYVSSDLLGNVRLVTSATGAVVSRHDFAPFGEELSNSLRTSLDTRYGLGEGLRQRFTGKERDSATGLDYFGARYFSSQQGRFMSADAPLADQHIGDPQSWNLYAYVRNNPLRYIDPTGHSGIGADPLSADELKAVGAHAAATGIGIARTRSAYVARARTAKSAQRDALKLEYREKGPALGRELAREAAADPARTAARAAKTDAQLAESAGRTSAGVTGTAEAFGKVGAVATGVTVGLAIADVATAPDGEKLETAGRNVAGATGAIGLGELGATVGSLGGPEGTILGGFVGSLLGWGLGEGMVDNVVNPQPPQPAPKRDPVSVCVSNSQC